MENPFYISWLVPEIRLHSPRSGIITVSKGDAIHFELKTSHTFEKLR